MSDTPRTRSRASGWIALTIFSVVILVPACYGFGNKFLEFLGLVGYQEGAFVLPAVLSYLLSTLGFFFLLGWAIFHGMFRDVEGPKYTMLEQEKELNSREHTGPFWENPDGSSENRQNGRISSSTPGEDSYNHAYTPVNSHPRMASSSRSEPSNRSEPLA